MTNKKLPLSRREFVEKVAGVAAGSLVLTGISGCSKKESGGPTKRVLLQIGLQAVQTLFFRHDYPAKA